MSDLANLLRKLNFSSLQSIQDCSSIADIIPTNERCGVYILQFLNGEVYVGQATDIARRYLQHVKTYEDIQNVAFKATVPAVLSEEERSIIWELEQNGFTLRNVTFTSTPRMDSEFDSLMPVDAQMQWLSNVTVNDWTGNRVEDELLRTKYNKKFQRLIRLRDSDEAIDVLKRYINSGIPIPMQSEVKFWGCSCLPSYNRPGVTIYSRININWQEVFTVAHIDGRLSFSFHVALTPLQKAFGDSLDQFYAENPALSSTEHFYEPGGHDQIHLEIIGAENVNNLLRNEILVKAIRLFNLRLMKKGQCAYRRYHCLALADKLLASN